MADCFGSIPRSGLMSAVEERISDRRLLALLRAFLRAGVMEAGLGPTAGDRAAGRGGVPVARQRLLHRLDRAWRSAYGTTGPATPTMRW